MSLWRGQRPYHEHMSGNLPGPHFAPNNVLRSIAPIASIDPLVNPLRPIASHRAPSRLIAFIGPSLHPTCFPPSDGDLRWPRAGRTIMQGIPPRRKNLAKFCPRRKDSSSFPAPDKLGAFSPHQTDSTSCPRAGKTRPVFPAPENSAGLYPRRKNSASFCPRRNNSTS